MNRLETQEKILLEALKSAPFEGWNTAMLRHAAVQAGLKPLEADRVFPGGAADALSLYSQQADEATREAVQRESSFGAMKIREKIAFCVRVRLEFQQPHKEAVRRALAYTLLPSHAVLGSKMLYQTTDTIWRLAGDTSTDFNFYTKRLLLAKVYSATLLYWLNDESPQHQESWEFLARRINDVLAFGKWKAETTARAKRILKDWMPRSA